MSEPARTPEPDTAEPTRGSRWQTFKRAPRAVRWTAWTALALVLVLILLAAAVVVVVRRPLPQTSGEIEVAGLSASVEVVRDEHGIAQVYADTDADLVFAQGFVHAQERFFEMDFRRHVTAGRLSEIFGEETLETDKFIRTMGWRRVAERELSRLDPRTVDYLEAFSAGVNAYLESRSPTEMSLEYGVLALNGLDYVPEEWTPVDSLAWLKAMAWDLRGNMEDEIDRALASGHLDTAAIDELYPPYPYDRHRPIVEQGAVVDGPAAGPGRWPRTSRTNGAAGRRRAREFARRSGPRTTPPRRLDCGEPEDPRRRGQLPVESPSAFHRPGALRWHFNMRDDLIWSPRGLWLALLELHTSSKEMRV